MKSPRDRVSLNVSIVDAITLALLSWQKASAQTPATTPTLSPAAAGTAAPGTRDLQADLQRAQDKLKDWPNLGRYRDANALVQAPGPEENRVVFMGDSITDNWGQKYGKFFPDKPYINRGISGQTTPQILIRFRPYVIALRPKAVVILAGTNDVAGNTGPAPLEAIDDTLACLGEVLSGNGIPGGLAPALAVGA